MIVFGDFDLSEFWTGSDYEKQECIGVSLTDELLSSVEAELGVRLPCSYVELMRHQNGGIPRNEGHRMSSPTTWADDRIKVAKLHAIDPSIKYALCGTISSAFWLAEWGYPDIGVYFFGTPSGGHDMLALDYRTLGANGEPEVVHVDQEARKPYTITRVAPSFEAFIRGLESEANFPFD